MVMIFNYLGSQTSLANRDGWKNTWKYLWLQINLYSISYSSFHVLWIFVSFSVFKPLEFFTHHEAGFRGQTLLVLARQCSLLLCGSTVCVSYLLLAAASCGLQTLSFLTSFPFPNPSHTLVVIFCLQVWRGGEICMYYSGSCSFPYFSLSLLWHCRRSSSLLLNPHLWT